MRRRVTGIGVRFEGERRVLARWVARVRRHRPPDDVARLGAAWTTPTAGTSRRRSVAWSCSCWSSAARSTATKITASRWRRDPRDRRPQGRPLLTTPTIATSETSPADERPSLSALVANPMVPKVPSTTPQMTATFIVVPLHLPLASHDRLTPGLAARPPLRPGDLLRGHRRAPLAVDVEEVARRRR